MRRDHAGGTGLGLIAGSVACTAVVGFAGPSIMEPMLPGRSGQPPWTLELHMNPYAASGLSAAGLVLGAAGLVLALRAVRAGWAISPRLVLLLGAGAALVVSQGGPFGSSDFLSYAAYGRELVTGHNPYVVAPEALARLGDPVARAVQDWAGAPSVYGALANGVFGLASLGGGASARLTVWVFDLVSALAFIGTGVLLDRIARDRLRAALLWTCNPLLLQILVAGAHVDTLAVFFAVAGIAVLSSGASVPRGLLAGVLVGCGFVVKPTVALVGLGIAVFGGGAALGSLAAGFAAVAGADIALMGRAGIADSVRASGMVSVGSPWRLVRTALNLGIPESAADDVVRWCAVLCGLLLAAVLLKRSRWRQRTPSGTVADGAITSPLRDAMDQRGPLPGVPAGVWAAFALVIA